VVQKVLAGVVLAVASVVALFIGDGLGWDVDAVLFLGAGVGGALGLMSRPAPLPRLGGFLLGLLAASVGYALRAAILPDSTGGRAAGIVITIAVAVGLVLLTFGRVPLWTALLGVGALGGAYEVAFTDSPGSVLTTLPAWLTLLLFMVAVGFASTVFFAEDDSRDESPPGRRRAEPAGGGDEAADADAASLDDVLTTGRG
jgi:hypothetical protein